MNDTPNEVRWRKGDVVIHDADRRCNDMLMVVIGYNRNGLCRTQYVNAALHSREVYANDICYLHDPHRPDIRARWKPSPATPTDLFKELSASWLSEPKPVATVTILHPADIIVALREHRGDWVKLEGGEGVDHDLFVAWLLKSIWSGIELRSNWNQELKATEYFMRDTGQHAEQELP